MVIEMKPETEDQLNLKYAIFRIMGHDDCSFNSTME